MAEIMICYAITEAEQNMDGKIICYMYVDVIFLCSSPSKRPPNFTFGTCLRLFVVIAIKIRMLSLLINRHTFNELSIRDFSLDMLKATYYDMRALFLS